jgi:CRISPR-associated protein Cas2
LCDGGAVTFYVVIYDIPDDKRRKRVFDLLTGYGTRVQYSAFECVLSDKKFTELQNRLRRVVNLEEDSLRFYPMPRHSLSQAVIWGGVPLTEPSGSTIV